MIRRIAFVYLFVALHMALIFGTNVSDVCPIKNIEGANNETLAITSSKELEEIWFNFGQDFLRLTFRLRVKYIWNGGNPSYIFDEDLVLNKTDVLPTNDSVTWNLMIVSVLKKKRFGQNTIYLQAVINKRAHILDTKLWWRQYEAQEFYVFVEGGLKLALGCMPDEPGPTQTTTTILSIVLPIIFALVVIAFIVIFFIRRRQKNKNAVESREEPTYESLEEFALNKNKIFTQPLPAIPSSPKNESNCEMRDLACERRVPAPENHYQSPVKTTRSLSSDQNIDDYTYDVPKSSLSSDDQNHESHYMPMNNM